MSTLNQIQGGNISVSPTPFSTTLEQMTQTPFVGPFGRQTVVEPFTLWDSKLLTAESNANFWTEAELSGSGTGTSYSSNTASVTMTVGANTAGVRARQTRTRFNYQSGKGHLVLTTFVFGAAQAGITKRVGYFDTNNGLFFQLSGSTLSVVRRTSTSGSPIDNVVNQADWNLDRLDGTGSSGYTFDPSKTQIGVIEMEWLGVGRVRMGFDIDGQIIYVHEFRNANNLTVVYMSTPNNPVRFEIQNDGTGGASSLVCICSSVMSLGGQEQTGLILSENTGSTSSTATSVGTNYALMGIRLKSTHYGINVDTLRVSILGTSSNDNYLWELRYNPTITGTFTYSGITGASVEIAKTSGTIATTVSGGTLINSGYGQALTSITTDLRNTVRIGADINGAADSVVLSVVPLGASLGITSSFTWREAL
jgi:hypothetical protein